ncbi:hypothetical protein C0075_17370 [Rhizobium sp. KAs_5_22]|uniref:hypothetical protein n=1 Tax=Ciceribacter selenitireducens TaxID=448181 RepID=UPI00048CA10C|nr:hypothetical protein [Ciceribacter selenitireducens]PPJ47335.1 hypothetical protein C0075_17370 [Rhizobium sp. KAs_5_22]
MKTLAFSAAVLSLSAGFALADCGAHTTSAAVNVDRQMTTASIVPDEPAVTDVVLLKQSRLPAEEKVSTE